MDLLDANDRTDAIAVADVMFKMNAPAVEYASRVNWTDYKYAAIIVPGEGPDNAQTKLSPLSKLRLKMAMQMYSNHMAPFIITSGGFVHPSHTIHGEGINMREWLIEQYQIDPHRVLVDPHARHTTTNLRNAARELLALNYPPTQKLLVVTDPLQMEYIMGSPFTKRAINQLGYSLGDIGEYVSPWGLEYVPSPNVTFVDPMDPLDP